MTLAATPPEPIAPALPPSPLEHEGITIRVASESRLMQNYRVASPVHGGSSTATIVNDAGHVEFFTSGIDTMVWNYYEEPKSKTGILASARMTGELLATDLTPIGKVVLFASQGTMLTYQVQNLGQGERWGDVKHMNVELPSGAVRIARIYTAQIGAGLYIGVLVQTQNGTYGFSYGIWGSKAPEKLRRVTQLNVSSLNGVWTGNSDDTAAFTLYDNIIVRYDVATGTVQRPEVAQPFHTIDVCAVNDSHGNSQVLAIHDDCNVYILCRREKFEWQRLTKNVRFKKLALLRPGDSLEVLLLSESNQIYHWSAFDPIAPDLSLPLPIHDKTQSFAVASKDSGQIELFAIGDQQNTVTRLTRGSIAAHWAEVPLELAVDGSITEFPSFTSDVTVYDATGSPLGNTHVQVWAEEACRLTINGGVYYVTASQRAWVKTNSAATLSISQEPSSLTAPALLINVTGKMKPAEFIVIRQNAQVQKTLHNVTAKDLLSATVADGSHLLAEKYHTERTATSIAEAINRFMGITALAYRRRTAGDFFLHCGHESLGVTLHTDNSLPPGALLSEELPEQHWNLWEQDGQLFFRNLSAEEAAEKLTYLRSTASISNIFNTITDIVSGVAKGIIKVVEQVIHTVKDEIEVLLTYIVDGVKRLLTVPVDTVAAAFDLTHTVFGMVQVFFADLYEWLGYFFNWDDILRTRDAISYTVDVGLEFLSGAAGGMQKYFDRGIDTLQRNMHDWFAQIEKVMGNLSIGSYLSQHTPQHPATSLSVANNIIYNGLVNNASAASCRIELLTTSRNDAGAQEFADKLATIVDFTQSKEAFQKAFKYFEDIGTSPDKIFTSSLCGLLSLAEGILQAICSGVQVVFDALVEIIQALVKQCKEILKAEWNIPFVSQLYAQISNGKSLTTLDLFSLTLAVPGTILYRSLKGRAPFPDKGTVDTYTSKFSAESLLKASRLSGSGRHELPRTHNDKWSGVLPPDLALAAGVFGAVAYFYYGNLTGLMDGLPPDEAPLSVISWLAFLCECGVVALSNPWFFSMQELACTADCAACVLWLYMCVGLALDLFFLTLAKTMPQIKDDAGTIATCIYSLPHLALAALASINKGPTVVVTNIVPAVPEFLKPLRLSSVAAATEDISPAVLAAVDVFCCNSATILSVINVIEATKSETTVVSLTPFGPAA